MKSLFEELGGTYRQVGDYLVPDIELPERNYEIGKYGRMRHRYLKEHCEAQYVTMVLGGTSYDHLEEVDRICNERTETMAAATKKQQDITEALKAGDANLNKLDTALTEHADLCDQAKALIPWNFMKQSRHFAAASKKMLPRDSGRHTAINSHRASC